MSGIFWLDAAALAVSLHNMILLLWLGLTVLLNAERRTWSIGLVGGALLLGSAFFISHSVILMLGLNPSNSSLDFWWHLGFVPIVILPFGWYATTLWYAGFWDNVQNELHSRQRSWFLFAALLTAGLGGLLVFANPLPSFAQAANFPLKVTLDVSGMPLLILVYTFDILLCITLSLDALRRPAPSTRVMGDLARQRARPWLIGVAVVLLTVGLLAAWLIVWITANARQGLTLDRAMIVAIAWFDLIIASLIALSIILVGEAMALYEVFTGKALPRRGLLRQWHNAMILALGYGIVMGASLTVPLLPIYGILLATALMTIFHALLSWRSFAERDRAMRHLRPFVASQHLYDHLLQNPASPSDVDIVTPFRALCRDVLGTRLAYLSAVGPLAPLVPPLSYPDPKAARTLSLAEIARFDSSQTICLPLDPAGCDGAQWAVPLWSERGLSGLLMLGEKSDGGMYALEEIEIARASGERLIDTCASAELARRLMALQRQRLAESQLLDRQAKRVLHDEVLPRLHAALLALNDEHAHPEAMGLLTHVHREMSDLLRDMPTAAAPEISRVGLFDALKGTIEQEWALAFDNVTWQIEPDAESNSKAIPSLTAEVLFYAAREAIRNAARYGRGANSARSLNLRVQARWSDRLMILIEDDGVGLQSAERSEQGSGQGLVLHSAMLAVIGGTLAVEPMADGGTRVTLTLPLSA